MSTRRLHDCFAVHKKLAGSAILLARRLGSWGHEADQLRLGASCIQIAAERALAAHSEREAILGWSECELGDRQIRGATYRALALGRIGNGEYDETFDAAIVAARIRRDELLRLRRRMRVMTVI